MKYKKYQQGAVWTLNECKQDASKYKSRNAWKEGNYAAYNKAVYNGWMGQCCAHMESQQGRVRKAEPTFEQVREVAQKVSSYKEFREDYESYYLWALKNKKSDYFKALIKKRISQA
ncbi:hypothetical protein [Planctobacterium marinum]|uniref:Uncharacterized protein n=1 Tax=Planctobacterium marinum TaxID=1631968 RepID=A0AA48HWF0_9ALTE|nr:hypothetical protein MACH26_26290 [Planctobacterium marinum]